MGDRMTCPGCDAHTSDVLGAYERWEPCPHCGLSPNTMQEILVIRSRRANAEVTKLAENAIKDRDRFSAENAKLRRVLEEIRDAVDEIGDPTL